MNKKGQNQSGVMWGIVSAVLAFVVLGVTLTVGLTINDEAQDETITNTAGCNSTHTNACGFAYNAAEKVSEGGYRFGKFAPLMGLAIAGGATLTILIGSLAYFRMR